MQVETVYDVILFVLILIMFVALDVFAVSGTYYYLKEKKQEFKK